MKLKLKINDKSKEIKLEKKIELKINGKNLPIYTKSSEIKRTNFFNEVRTNDVSERE